MALTESVEAALSMGDLPLAERTLDRASPEQRHAFEYLLYTARLAMRRGNYEKARSAFEEAASHDQESPSMHSGLGFIELRDGDRPAAHAHFQRALDVATDKMEALYDIVSLCQSGGFGSDARPYAEQLLKLASGAIAANPGEPDLYATRATAYSALGEDKLAARDAATKRSLLGWWADLPGAEGGGG